MATLYKCFLYETLKFCFHILHLFLYLNLLRFYFKNWAFFYIIGFTVPENLQRLCLIVIFKREKFYKCGFYLNYI